MLYFAGEALRISEALCARVASLIKEAAPH